MIHLHPRHRLGAGALLAFGALTLAACGATGSADGPAKGTSPHAKTAQAALAQATKPFTQIPNLGTPFDAAKLKGKTVFYVPFALKVEYFGLVQKNLQEALKAVGVTMRTCDGGGTPTGVNNCLSQARAQGAAAVITDYVPYALVATGVKQLEANHIPVYLASTTPPPGVEQSAQLAVGDVLKIDAPIDDAMADLVIADSDAKAHVLLVQNVDTDALKGDAQRIRDHFATACPGCTVTTVNASLSSMTQLPSLVSSALLKDPSINYVVPQTDTYLSAAVSGIQAASRTSNIRLATSSANLATVQQLKSDGQFIGVAGNNPNYIAWTMADSVMRMMSGQIPPASYPNLPRTFTKDNVGGLDLTPAGAASGSWYGDVSLYQDSFRHLWGLK